jgi:hypothetical protein
MWSEYGEKWCSGCVMSYRCGNALCDASMAKAMNKMFEELLTMF